MLLAASLVGVYVLLCVGARIGYRVLSTLLRPTPALRFRYLPTRRCSRSRRMTGSQSLRSSSLPRTNKHARSSSSTATARRWTCGCLSPGLCTLTGSAWSSPSTADTASRATRRGPHEAGLYGDASAVLDALQREGIGRDRVALLGISLGTGVAVEMAARDRAAALVLISPYTSIPAVAAAALLFLPARWICPDRFDTLSKAPGLRVPTLVIHGDADEVVPFTMGRQVAAAVSGATMRIVAGGHHNDLFLTEPRQLVEAYRGQR